MDLTSRARHIDHLVRWAEMERSHPGRFIADGPFDWERWNQQHYRVMFLLKEAYDSGGSDPSWVDTQYDDTVLAGRWSLATVVKHAFVYGGHMPRTWQNLYSWAKAMLNFEVDRLPDWDVPSDPDELWSCLSRCAFVNIKKYDGVAKSSYRDLVNHLREPSPDGGSNRDQLTEQVRLLDPHLVVCCNTLDPVINSRDRADTVFPESVDKWGVGLAGKSVWLDYWHPAWHSAPRFLLVQGLHAMRVHAASLPGMKASMSHPE